MRDTTRGISQIWLHFPKESGKIVRIFAIFLQHVGTYYCLQMAISKPKKYINK
jgi:hypothetical protein